jgi:hypothetical protein
MPLESGIPSLLKAFSDRKTRTPSNLHWCQPVGIGRGFKELAITAQEIGSLPQDFLYKMTDPTRKDSNQFAKVISILANFTDQNNEEWGPVDEWGPDRALVMDGLTGLSNFAMHMVVGKKPILSPTDWGVAQKQIENLLRMLCDQCKCHFVMLAHIERETDQITGGVKVMTSTLGKALPPKIPPMFNDVILTVRERDKWTWDTANSNVDLKTSFLPVASSQQPDFALIVDKWKSVGGRFSHAVANTKASNI